MAEVAPHAPGIPADYYRRISLAEQRHWWYRGMREISVALLGSRWGGSGTRLLDAGCGTGGFARFALDTGGASTVAGADLASDAIALAGELVPEADLHVAALDALPFADGAFDVVVCNDVLQHLRDAEVGQSLEELRRVLATDGALLLRTNGARRLRVERDDWRAYDASTLEAQLAAAGLRCARRTYANTVLSLFGAARGSIPRAPTDEHDGIPVAMPPRAKNAVGLAVLRAEARYLRRPGRSLPFGHTLFALAVPA